jgi:hypothetical protein
MAADTVTAGPRRPLVLDTRRVLSTADDVFRRLPAFVAASHARTRWAHHGEASLVTVANLVAYHVARSGDVPLADRILRAELSYLQVRSAATPRATRAQLALDPFLNRIRLAAMTGEVDAALAAIDGCLGGDRNPAPQDDRDLRYAAGLFAGPARAELHDLLRAEKLFVTWRSGRLSAMPSRSAHQLVAECAGPSTPLRDELELRLQLGAADPPGYRVRPSDTLKRALHRAVVHVDEIDPMPDDRLADVVRRGLEHLHAMSFVCPGTPRLWARTAHRWLAAHSLDGAELAEQALSRADAKVAAAVARGLDQLLGAPFTGDPRGATSSAAEHAEQVVALLETLSDAGTEVSRHA